MLIKVMTYYARNPLGPSKASVWISHFLNLSEKQVSYMFIMGKHNMEKVKEFLV